MGSLFIELLYFGFGEGCGTQLKQETMSRATCFCCEKVCVFRKGWKDTMPFQPTVFPWFSCRWESFHDFSGFFRPV